METSIDTREQSAPPTPEVNSGGTPFQQPQSKGPSQTSPVLFINDRQTQLDGNGQDMNLDEQNLWKIIFSAVYFLFSVSALTKSSNEKATKQMDIGL